MDRTPNEPSNPISRAFAKFFERGKVGGGKPAKATSPPGATPQAAPRTAAPRPAPAGTGAVTPTAQPGLQAVAPAARPASAAATHAASAQRTHTVAKGETLSGIAQKVYGRADRWPAIFEANRDRIDDPDRIYPGQVLKIPDAPSMH